MTKKTSTPKEETTAVSLFGQKAELPAYAVQDKGQGNENVGSEDQAVPQIKLLQALSPECESVEGAKPGFLYNTVTGELTEELYVINLYFTKEFAVWRDRDLGGGLMDTFDTEREAREYQATLPGDYQKDYAVSETHLHLCLLVDEQNGVVSPCRFYMDRTKLSTSKSWNTEIALLSADAPRFASIWRISPKSQTNKKNQKFYNLETEFVCWAPEAVYADAKENYEGLIAAKNASKDAA